MNFYQALATVLLRVWSATIMIYGAYALLNSLLTQVSYPDGFEASRLYFISNILSLSIYLLIGVALWFLAPVLGKKTVDFPTPSPRIEGAAVYWISIGVFLIGMFHLVSVGPKALVNSVVAMASIARQTDADRLSGVQTLAVWDIRGLATSWVTLILALVLMLRAHDAGKLFAWLRNTGHYDSVDSEDKKPD